MKVKKTAFKNWIAQQTEEAQQQYIWAREEAKECVVNARLEHFHDLYEWLDTKEGEKSGYRLVKVWARATKDIEHYVCVKDKEGQCMEDRSKVLPCWKQHFDEICNVKSSNSPIPHGSATAGPIPCIVPEEFRKAIQCMKKRKHNVPVICL